MVMKKTFFALFLFFIWGNVAIATTPNKIRVLYNSLDTRSVSQHLAFYQLYPDSPEGMRALRHVWTLLSPPHRKLTAAGRTLPQIVPVVNAIISLVNKQPNDEVPSLSNHELWAIDELAQHLANRKLEGHYAKTEKEVIDLPFEEVDLARGLFLSQMGDDSESMVKLRSYEAMIDLMALQILARIPMDAPPRAKINEINHFIFDEMGFRFPPHSLYAKDIDLYTFLPSVLDSRRGVCLGVSILYLSIAQRLDLTLEMITPPGHIYVRYRDPSDNTIINIETTARGVDIESEVYLSVGTRSLQHRNIKDVIGLAHFNEASVHWQRKDHEKAVASYCKAQKYLPDDPLLKELLGYNYLLIGEKEKGIALLEQIKGYTPDHAITKEVMSEDYLLGNVDAEGLDAVFMHIDEKRESILKKKERLEKVLERYPNFRTGQFCLATTWLQLHRLGEALEVLKKYHELHPFDPTAEYYLAMVYAERLNYSKAWEHLNNAIALTKEKNHSPKPLKMLRKELAIHCPE